MVSTSSFSETFSDSVHGWMNSRYASRILFAEQILKFKQLKLTKNRADFEDLHKFEEYLRGYRIVREFFAQFL